MDGFAFTPCAMVKDWFGDIPRGDIDLLAGVDLLDTAFADRVGDRLLYLRLEAAYEALSVYGALVFSIKASVDYLAHWLSLSRGFTHTQIPFGEQAHLLFRISLIDHAVYEILVLLLVVGRRLGVEGDHR